MELCVCSHAMKPYACIYAHILYNMPYKLYIYAIDKDTSSNYSHSHEYYSL